MVSVAIIGQRHSEEFWFGPGLHVTRLATMKGKHHGEVYPATVNVSVGYNFFWPYLFIYGLCYDIMAGFASGTTDKHDKLPCLFSNNLWPVPCLWKASEINGDRMEQLFQHIKGTN